MASLAEYLAAQRAKSRKKKNIFDTDSGSYFGDVDTSEERSTSGGALPSELLKLDMPQAAPVGDEPADVASGLGFSSEEEEIAANLRDIEAGKYTNKQGEAEATKWDRIQDSKSKTEVETSEDSAGVISPIQREDRKFVSQLEAQAPTPKTIEAGLNAVAAKEAEIPDPGARKTFAERVAALRSAYEAKKSTNEWGQVADLIGQGLVRLGAGLYGMKHGVDVSGIKFSTFDWEKKLDRLGTDLNRDIAAEETIEARGLADAKESRDSTAFKTDYGVGTDQAKSYIDLILTQYAKDKKNTPEKLEKLRVSLEAQPVKDLRELYKLSEKSDDVDWFTKQSVLFKNRLEGDKLKQKDIDDRAIQAALRNEKKNFENDTVVKKLKEQGLAFDQVGGILSALELGNQVAMGAVGAKMAKAMGEVGVLTDEDVKRYIQAQTYWRGLADSAKRKIIDGAVTDSTIEDMKEIISKLKSGSSTKYNETLNRYVDAAYSNVGPESLLQGNITRDQVIKNFGLSPDTVNKQTEASRMVRVRGKNPETGAIETLEIERTNLPDAEADGYKEVK